MLGRMTGVILALMGSAAQAADLSFCWFGKGGYVMAGRMQVASDAMSKPIVTEDDLVAFKITGYHHGQVLGTWDMSDAADDSTWHLRFDPERMTFLTGHSFPTTKSQGWNANGGVRDCGAPGFGFNAGSAGQDICVNGRFIAESSVPPETPLIATPERTTRDCTAQIVFSKFSQTES